MIFEEAHKVFMKKHTAARKGESLRRLKEGHDHAEKLFLELVWWPAFGNFNHLHPEYETYDYKDGDRYIDFAYIQSFIKLAIEIDSSDLIGKTSTAYNSLIIEGAKMT